MKTFYKDKNKKKSEEDIKKDIQNIEKTKSFVIWVQEFSKKIVTVTFLLYVAITIFIAFLVYKSMELGVMSGIDTLITEINQTFRDVVGGYIVKAAVENAVKIGGSFYIKVAESKLAIYKQELKKKHPDIEFDTTLNTDDFAG